ncbi:hypothetical protein [Erythrobacter sp. YT30]|uniref:hypothetical protein n=1 Tax=Erythrobacter sp. YT30 TaxID=1735012 RepID=UPI00076C42C4|nr:hypothetical protein [Erythrobacter sp. YT30]KWV93373.1 hypothetical protein AUC45_04520 [Erythrobacter sp. YT30]
MPQKRRRSPQEKKALSYAKDRRNLSGMNDKASRKCIPRSRARGHRVNRRQAASKLSRYVTFDEDAAALEENAMLHDLDRLGRWKKWPDQTLAEKVEQQNARRRWRKGRKVWSKKAAEEAEKRGLNSFGRSWGGSEEASSLLTIEGGKLIKVRLD